MDPPAPGPQGGPAHQQRGELPLDRVLEGLRAPAVELEEPLLIQIAVDKAPSAPRPLLGGGLGPGLGAAQQLVRAAW